MLFDLKTDPSESNDVANENPEMVSKLKALADETRGELGEYSQRGSGQRPTGSAIADAPIIPTAKDWGTVDPDMAKRISDERQKRYPDMKFGKKAKRPKKKK